MRADRPGGSKQMATVDDILRTTLTFNIGGGSVGNLVHHYRVTAGTETDYVAIATAIDAALATAYTAVLPSISNEVVPISADLSEWDSADEEWDGKASVTGTAPAGSGTTPPMPSGMAGVLRFPTAELRRQARKFLPGMLEADSDGDAILGPAIAEMVTVAALLNNDITAGALTIRPCTFNDTVGSLRFGTSSDFSTTSIVNTNWGYQRRRQPGAGI